MYEIARAMIIRTAEELHATMLKARAEGKRIGFVPTMGALHAGHRSLVEQSVRENDITVCSIFVNPTQFNDPKDLEKYPRSEDQDVEMLSSAGCTYVFMPSVKEMYPDATASMDIEFGDLERTMEGAFRPGHFKGVATIVNRLFSIAIPHKAYFGEKDFQQLAVIRALVKKLNIPVEIIGCATLREADGLAMSSRNLLLTKEQRAAAPVIYKSMQEGQAMIPAKTPAEVKAHVIAQIEKCPLFQVQYFSIVDQLTLQEVENWEGRNEVQACIAVVTSGPRLIDNMVYRLLVD